MARVLGELPGARVPREKTARQDARGELLPPTAPPPEPSLHGPATPPRAAPAAAVPLPVPLEPLLDGARGAVNPASAHLRLDAGGAGELALHLRLRGGVADVRVEGDGAQALAGRSAELTRALAAEGISLRRLDAEPSPAPAQAQGGAHGGTPGDPPGGGSSAWAGARERPADAERRDPREPAPARPPPPPPARRPAARAGLDVEA